MASSISGSSSQSTTSAATNQSTVTGSATVTLNNVSSFTGLQSHTQTTIGGVTYTNNGPTSMAANESFSWSDSRVYTHDANGVRGAVDVSFAFYVDGTTYHQSSATAAQQPALDYDRKPGQPSTVTAVVNSDKTITVTVAAVTSLASAATYYCAYSNGSGYGTPQSSSSNVFTFTGLPRGATYTFSGYASNTDGTSATTYSSNTFLTAGGQKWTGTVFTPLTTTKKWTGSAWQDITIARKWTGTIWQDLT